VPSLSEPSVADAATALFADQVFTEAVRRAALQRYRELPSGRERPGRFWRVDLDALALDGLALDPAAGSVEIACADPRVVLGKPSGLALTGAGDTKFGSLTIAFANRYAFVFVPAGADVAEPIVVTYRAGAGEAIFPYTCVHAERGARVTVIERIETDAGAFVCGVTEIVSGEGADVTLASLQNADSSARALWTRSALPGKDATLHVYCAEIGAALAVGDLDIAFCAPGANAEIGAIFFPSENQHVDLRSTVDHRVGGATSVTAVKSAATGRGQARYVGNIRIAPQAQKSDASLRDDALLLSPTAHIDSVPALEIGANNVRAFHGATVGALDAETLFYMTTRGIEREAAEKMVTIGFFEPLVERFPQTLRDQLRDVITRKAG
jgi:Fe-S cluster assembly protein SufD